jgi:antitoxin component YwqK of YwqJK toxin-antitoxin module
MLFVFASLSSIVWAQDEAALLNAQGSAARNYLPEAVVNLLPNGLQQKVDRWENAGHKGRIITGWYANGQKAVVFAHKGGHLHGQWQTWYENGVKKEQGHFSNGHPDGTWQFWYRSGSLKSERNFSAAKLQAINIASRQRNPKLQFVPVTGKEPSSKETTTIHPEIAEGTRGILHIDLPFHKAVHEGDFVNFSEDGRIVAQGKFLNGLRDGQWLYYQPTDGKTITGYYIHGSKHGPWRELAGDTLISLSEYKAGKLVFQKHYLASGSHSNE